MGASRVDVGQDDDVTWDVLADPEGNEFCVLSSRDDLSGQRSSGAISSRSALRASAAAIAAARSTTAVK